MADERIVVEVEANLSKLDRGLRQAEGKVKASSSRMSQSASVGVPLAGGGGIGGRLILGASGLVAITQVFRSIGAEIEKNIVEPTYGFRDAMADVVNGLESYANTVLGTNKANFIREKFLGGLGYLSGGLLGGAVGPDAQGRGSAVDSALEIIRQAEEQIRAIKVRRGEITQAEFDRIKSLNAEADRQEVASKLESAGVPKDIIQRVRDVLKALSSLEQSGASAKPKSDEKALVDSFETVMGTFRIAGGQGVVKAQADAAKATERNTKRIEENTRKTASAMTQIARSLVGFA